jgi:hypothetical protein
MEDLIMAKRIIKWTLDNTTLNMHKYVGTVNGKENATELICGFELVELFPDFTTMADIQKQVIVYGIKQKLMDKGASEIADTEGKIVSAKNKFADLVAGKWSGDRTNATGAAEDKRAFSELKTLTKEVSMNGLMMKRLMYPATFTDDDETKLQEFINRAAKQGRK